ncbi:unnamed protein product [Rotaria socialis]|uniref:Uncharacterized protein n=1 Tax=Rotaria socialis TaxID=392032 RepID=A0A820C216_9BILA|nr:unnamed protein product [Rotaria socialis]CAF3429686.1 unnamed protein product [Rotaria socialis]CAF3585830.1 unnamed protein product [Rotaria socialis]CAF3751091.1 unnamed protein product [Rotaria socialis]CAF4209313.1 unnamed protein product [Rotaria socialis]
MTCKEANCKNLSCALCYDCQQSLCLSHIIVHHNRFIERHLSFYEILQQLYHKLHSMSIEQCYKQVFEELSLDRTYAKDTIVHLRAIREELIEQLNKFKLKQFNQLKSISFRLHDTNQMINKKEENEIKIKLEQIQASINSLVYGIHLEISKTTKKVQCRKLFHHKTQSPSEMKADLILQKSSSWTNGSSENFWKKKTELDERLSLF